MPEGLAAGVWLGVVGRLPFRTIPLGVPGMEDPLRPCPGSCKTKIVVYLDDQRYGQSQGGDVGLVMCVLAVRVGLRSVKVLVSQLRAVAEVHSVEKVVEVSSFGIGQQ